MVTEAWTIEDLAPGETARALAFYADYGAADAPFLREGMAKGGLAVVMAVADGRDVGGFYLNFAPKYVPYQRMHIPELQDLRVDPAYRRRGIARALIARAEALAKPYGALGISVGLHGAFGAAQRLYARLGFVPDGQGVTYDRRFVTPGERLPVDNDLCLMMLKSLE